jgi:hypothetical protein
MVAQARSAWPSLPPRPALKVTLRPLVVRVFLIETKAETMSRKLLSKARRAAHRVLGLHDHLGLEFERYSILATAQPGIAPGLASSW